MNWELEFERSTVYTYPMFLLPDVFGECENYPDKEGEEVGEDFSEWGGSFKMGSE